MRFMFLIILCLNLLVFGCEQNPIGESNIDTPNRNISGTVVFDRSDTNPEGVLVWLEGFDMLNYTDSNGKFEFLLPPPTAQANPKGVSGAFNVFYYVSNYHLGITRVYTQNGNFLYSRGEVNSDGELTQKKTLFQRLETTVSVQPTSVYSEKINITNGRTDFLLSVDVSLRAARDSVVVFYPGLVEDVYGPLMFRNIESGEVKVLSSTSAGYVKTAYDTVDTNPVVRTMKVPIFPEKLGKGTFEIIPYILIEDMEIPDRIRGELKLDSMEPGEEYLKIPYIRSGRNRYFTLN